MTNSENLITILTKENEFYKTGFFNIQAENSLLKNKLAQVEEQLAWFQRQIFGKKSEKIVADLDNRQTSIFDTIEFPPAPKEEIQEVPAHVRRKPNRNGQDALVLPENLPVKTTVLDLPEEEKVCQKTGKALVKIGEEVSRKLAHEPGSFYIKEIIRPKYAIPNGGIATEALPEGIIPRCRADESFLAEILTQKFADHMPLNRIAEKMQRQDILVSTKLLSQWVVRLGTALKPLQDAMLNEILKSENIFVDETPVKFLEEKGSDLGYFWTICGGKKANPSYRVYNFRQDRKHDNILEMIKDYRGVLHSDKYGAYQKLAEQKRIVWAPCWAHIRRKFFEAESGDPPFREWVLGKIHDLFALDAKAWELSPEERLKIRQELEVPIIDELIVKIKDRLINGRILPQSKFKGALGYFCGLIPYLKNYTKYPFARLDNNVAERAIRPLALGRKNWLFFGSPNGGEAGSVILSLVQTCRNCGVNPRNYLEDILRRLMDHSSQKLYELLPDQWQAKHQ